MARALLMTALALGTAIAAAPAGAQPVAGDRYGPASAALPQAGAYGYGQPPTAATGAALRGRMLMWPGKVEPRAVVPAAPPVPAPTAAPAAYAWRGYAPPAPYGAQRTAPQVYVSPPPARPPARYAAAAPAWATAPTLASAPPPRQEPTLAGAPNQGWRPVFASAAAPAAAPRPAPPTSIYAPPAQGYSPAAAVARAAPPNRALAADRRYGYDPTQDHTVRFYSVARPFGLKPDPAPIPPQFFTATADLGGDPPGPLPVEHTTAAQRAAVVGGGDSGSQ